jgi:hypothetical protein
MSFECDDGAVGEEYSRQHVGGFPEGVGVAIKRLSVTRNKVATSLQRWQLSNFLNRILPKFHTSVPREEIQEWKVR